jgi:hypothetical protein
MTEVANIQLDTGPMQEYARFLHARAGEIMHSEVTAALYECLMLLEREVKEKTPVGVHGASGLRGSVTSRLMGEPLSNGLGVSGKVFSPLNYALPVELGAKPHWVPIQPLQDWVERVMGVDKSESRSVAFAISRRIAAGTSRGTSKKGVHMFEDALSEQSQFILKRLNRAVDEMIQRLEGGG